MFRNCLQTLLDILAGKNAAGAGAVFASNVVEDFQQAARLRPTDANLQTAIAGYIVMGEAAAKHFPLDPRTGGADALSEKNRAIVAENSGRLEQLVANPDTKTAATAHESLGFIHFMLTGATSDAEKHFRNAVTLDPANDRTWDMLTGISLLAKNYDKLIAVCAERVQIADTSRNRYLLAKAHYESGQLDKAADQLRRILQREPANFLAAAGLGAVQLRRGDDAKATDSLQRAAKLADDKTDPGQHADLRALQAIQAALAGDRATAEFHLGHALKLDKDNTNARAVLRALGP